MVAVMGAVVIVVVEVVIIVVVVIAEVIAEVIVVVIVVVIVLVIAEVIAVMIVMVTIVVVVMLVVAVVAMIAAQYVAVVNTSIVVPLLLMILPCCDTERSFSCATTWSPNHCDTKCFIFMSIMFFIFDCEIEKVGRKIRRPEETVSFSTLGMLRLLDAINVMFLIEGSYNEINAYTFPSNETRQDNNTTIQLISNAVHSREKVLNFAFKIITLSSILPQLDRIELQSLFFKGHIQKIKKSKK
ncbi:hypothetical protein EDC96DRAFT_589559 [Choanephora cucurbitarum]|nr:hypothetical protein EDC96DRAFT_589559 [Choanephora cucurbitarum]